MLIPYNEVDRDVCGTVFAEDTDINAVIYHRYVLKSRQNNRDTIFYFIFYWFGWLFLHSKGKYIKGPAKLRKSAVIVGESIVEKIKIRHIETYLITSALIDATNGRVTIDCKWFDIPCHFLPYTITAQ